MTNSFVFRRKTVFGEAPITMDKDFERVPQKNSQYSYKGCPLKDGVQAFYISNGRRKRTLLLQVASTNNEVWPKTERDVSVSAMLF